MPNLTSNFWLALFVILLTIIGFGFLWIVVLRPALQKTREDIEKKGENAR
jgi:competence protein ComGC